MCEQDTRKIINEIRASFGATPTTMTDEQIEAGREVYGAKIGYDMAVIDEVQEYRVIDYTTQDIGNADPYDLDTCEHMENGVSVQMCPNDSREKLEDDLEKLRKRWKEYDGNFMRIYSYVAYSQIVELLDRQAAITEREVKLRELYKFEENYRANIDATEEVNRKLNERIAELTAEREQYRDNMLAQSRRVAELTTERDELQAAIDAMGNGQFYAMYRKACDERDHFKDLVKESAERTCVPHGEWELLSQTQEFRRMYCDCGYELGMDTHETFPYEHTIYFPMPYFCPECGARIESKANAVKDE